ncbi:hypothetical protein EJ04DRAFT_581933 [Polyplosphaeria fusca]|uniref:GRF-type domain-containing protein n=1 Tax=Polyplosphaeria fusca TaxID=682080 RepID=A0A9P4QHV7_9PLEO|nr:hypothetical protein EJ04DRAFT_581933 [Polyplosphaeria fusca]
MANSGPGVFLNHAWYCDCNPRQAAVKFQVKKNTANKGKWFYTCQKPREDPQKCKFFLFVDQAKSREQYALQNNSHTESNTRPNVPAPPAPPVQPQHVSGPPPPYTVQTGPSDLNRKRGRVATEDDDFGFDQNDMVFNNELERIAVDAETPRKAARTDAFTTPSRRKLPWVKENGAAGLPTPQSDNRGSDLFQTRFAAPGSSFLTPSRFKEADDDDHPAQTPTPSRSFDAPTPTPIRYKESPSGGKEGALTRGFVDLLQQYNVALGEPAKQALDAFMNKHTESNVKSKEFLRKTIKAKDMKITELQHRVNTLEAELEAEKAYVQLLRGEEEDEGETQDEL